jgi:hypothetical protein
LREILEENGRVFPDDVLGLGLLRGDVEVNPRLQNGSFDELIDRKRGLSCLAVEDTYLEPFRVVMNCPLVIAGLVRDYKFYRFSSRLRLGREERYCLVYIDRAKCQSVYHNKGNSDDNCIRYGLDMGAWA